MTFLMDAQEIEFDIEKVAERAKKEEQERERLLAYEKKRQSDDPLSQFSKMGRFQTDKDPP